MHLLQCKYEFFSTFLSPWLLTNQASSLYQDTMVYCKDKMMKTNRLVIGLIFPELGSWEGFGLHAPVEMILPEWEAGDLEQRIQRIFGGESMGATEDVGANENMDSENSMDDEFNIKQETVVILQNDRM